MKSTDPIPASLADLPPTFPVQVASKILRIGRNRTYELVHDGTYPVRVIEDAGRFKVSRVELLRYLGYEVRAAS